MINWCWMMVYHSIPLTYIPESYHSNNVVTHYRWWYSPILQSVESWQVTNHLFTLWLVIYWCAATLRPGDWYLSRHSSWATWRSESARGQSTSLEPLDHPSCPPWWSGEDTDHRHQRRHTWPNLGFGKDLYVRNKRNWVNLNLGWTLDTPRSKHASITIFAI